MAKDLDLDDLEAVRAILAHLESFDLDVQDRILRWVGEKLDVEREKQRASVK